MRILLTGGAGYIGSHTAVVLTQAGHEVVILDNFCNSQRSVLERLKSILGKGLLCIDVDVRNTASVSKALRDYQIDAVIHFAGLKAVGESVQNPLKYYANNVQGSISVLQAMQEVGIKTFVFSSSATVYGDPKYLPYDEDHPTQPMNPYGWTKLQVEEILHDLSKSDPQWKISCLRYFNPVGAHDSGLIGEDPNGIPNNLMPFISKVASGELPQLNIFGNDYLSKDGTGERDYIHVMDLADGHMAALDFLSNNSGWHAINLGTGVSTSVLELVEAFEGVIHKKLPKEFVERRPGDLPIYYAKVDKAKNTLGWEAKRSLQDMCRSSWDFKKKNLSPAQ
ncbi:UDP-glucose 4-epimerase GalE [Polynucleobacter sp. 71A-WALBACH]|uniref:UDP-glucose 4-epimerase GalE n=1 Tax=Polynucleobacter sp. 71A-WALBACH TaxID=2689097 RepID=UPI001C0BBDE1|nr:UDP-glucose 4-epimerase GalE [Polynucleobacter sp. 71A-WALBACH]MBU3593260.1 UDP-glucose 4-epimerase GalE [Polynucleobacter sp. 71A-WALBACH]